MKLVGINSLKDFEAFLNHKEISTNIEDAQIFYIEEPQEVFFLDTDKLKTFNKVPELTETLIINDMKLLEAMKNRYIPIYDKKSKKILFTKEEYDKFRSKMSGLKEYNAGNFIFSDNLYFSELDYYLERIDENRVVVDQCRKPIYDEIKRIINECELSLTYGCNSGGDVELVEAGSTSRYTNIPSDIKKKWDFDFTIRFDPDKTWEIKEALETKLKADGHITRTSKFKVRLVDVSIPGLNDKIDLDFSLTPQKEVYLSTEDAINEKLNNIKMQDEDKYRLVIANIMYAKDLLKKNGAYKPSRGILDGDRQNGGLGGVGIENMILQNGGSFIDASIEFLECAEGKEFIEFEKQYVLMDFGCNHVEKSKQRWPYDNFVVNNMRYLGFNKMKDILENFIMGIKKEKAKQS